MRQARFRLQHTFPVPFDFLQATMASEVVPPSASRRILTVMLAQGVARDTAREQDYLDGRARHGK